MTFVESMIADAPDADYETLASMDGALLADLPEMLLALIPSLTPAGRSWAARAVSDMRHGGER